jgi:hypothetical protein
MTASADAATASQRVPLIASSPFVVLAPSQQHARTS